MLHPPVRRLTAPCVCFCAGERFRGGLVFEAHRLVYHSTLGLRVIKKKKVCVDRGGVVPEKAIRSEGWTLPAVSLAGANNISASAITIGDGASAGKKMCVCSPLAALIG